MNIALCSVGESPLSIDEIVFLRDRTGEQPLTWNRFIEVLLVTRSDLKEVFAYDNVLYKLKVTGVQLTKIFTHIRKSGL